MCTHKFPAFWPKGWRDDRGLHVRSGHGGHLYRRAASVDARRHRGVVEGGPLEPLSLLQCVLPISASLARPRHLLREVGSTLVFMLQSHKKAAAAMKAAQQRVEKATQERDKVKEKLKKAQARLALEKERLKKSQEQLES